MRKKKDAEYGSTADLVTNMGPTDKLAAPPETQTPVSVKQLL